MLKLKYLNENFDLARLALTHWAHDDATLSERLTWFRISSNAVYPFDQEGQLCFLRLSPAAEKNSLDLLGELDFLSFLEHRGYPAMRPTPSLEGQLILPLDTPWGLWYASAFKGVPGQSIESLPMTDQLAAAYGGALGLLHDQSMRYFSPIRRRNHRDILEWIIRTFTEHGAPDALLSAADEVSRLLAALPRTRESYGLVHYDFEPDNVFWDGERCHAIDFEDGMLHFYAIDAVQALDELPEDYHAAFLAGYRAACPNAAMNQRDFPLMRRFRDLYACARLLHALSEKPDPIPEWMPQLITRLENHLHELEHSICQP